MTSPAISVSQLTLYNPARLKDAEIVAAFVARKGVFDRLIQDLDAEKPGRRAQHHLIVGQRGMGKSTLLARVAAELRTDPNLSARFVPLVFAEEQYAVDRLSKFWLNCLDSLADAAERAGDQTLSDRIDATVRSLKPGAGKKASREEATADALNAFLKAAADGGKRPVLLVDNLQLVFERISDTEQHALRELLMRPDSPILVGASPSPPPQSQDYGAAFYDHFKTHYLRPLTDDDMRDLMLRLADITGRSDVRDKVLAHPERLKTLRDLTGGNPRTVVLLFFLYAEDFSPSVFADLENLLDRVTPLYKARMEELPEQQQVVVSAVADFWRPVTARELADATELAPASIAGQLDRLEKTGFVEKVEIFGQSSTGYQIAERFFNVWFLMRGASRRQRREVEFLVRFIESFYEAKDRPRLAQHLLRDRDYSPDRQLFDKALARTLDLHDKDELTRHAELDALRQKAAESRRKLEEVIDFAALPPATLAFNELRERLMNLVPADGGVEPEAFAEQVLGDRRMFMSGERLRLAAAPARMSRKQIEAVLRSTHDTKAKDVSDYDQESVEWFSRRLSSGQLRSPEDIEDWNRGFVMALDRTGVQLMVDSIDPRIGPLLSKETKSRIRDSLSTRSNSDAWSWAKWGYDLHEKLGLYSEAEAAFRKAIEIDPTYVHAWMKLGRLLANHLGRSTEAEAAFRRAIEIDPTYVRAWNNLGILLANHLGRSIEAEAVYRRAIEIDPTYAYVWNNLGNLLGIYLGRPVEAETAYRRAIEIDPTYVNAWNGLGNMLQNRLGGPVEAEAAYRRAIEVDPKYVYAWNGLGNLLCDHLQKYSEAAVAFRKALEIDQLNEWVRENQVFLYRDFLADREKAREAFEPLLHREVHEAEDTFLLHQALFSAYDSNWGQCRQALGGALDIIGDHFPVYTKDDWFRATAVLIHLNYGQELLQFLRERGDDAKRRPWYEAISALQQGDRRFLQNIPVEVRSTAEYHFDQIEKRLNALPEKTRRRPVEKPPKKRKPKR